MADAVHIDSDGERPLQRVRWILDSLEDTDSVAGVELYIRFDETTGEQKAKGDGGTAGRMGDRSHAVSKSTNQHTVLWILSAYLDEVEDTAVSRSALVDHQVTDGVRLSTDQLGNALSTLIGKGLIESPKTTGGPPPVMKKYALTDAGQSEIDRLGKPPTL